MNFGLDALINNLNTAISGSDSYNLPSSIYEALSGWISTYIMEMLWTLLLFIVFAFVFYGAFLYFTAYGDENRALMAKKTILYAFIGFAIGAAAIGISTYVRNILVEDRGINQMNVPVTTPNTTESGI